MPRKKRQLKQDLRREGFLVKADRGKGSHEVWYHPDFPDITVNIAGHDRDDAQHYDERNLRNAIRKVREQRGQ